MAQGEPLQQSLVAPDPDVSDPDVSTHVWSRLSQTRAFKTSAASIGVLAACAALYAAVSMPSGAFLGARDVETSLSSDGDSTFYIIKHTFKQEKDVDSMWKSYHEISEDDVAAKKYFDATAAQGFYNQMFLPTQRDGPFYCVWEVKAGKTQSDLQHFIDHDDFSGDMDTDVMAVRADLIGGINQLGLKPFFGPRRLEAKERPTTWYLIEHTFKHEDEIATWWKEAMALWTDADAMKNFVDVTAEKGFYNHLFLPTGRAGPFFCLWEAEAGKTKKDLQKFVDNERLLKVFKNDVMDLPLKLEWKGMPPMTPYGGF